MIWTKASTRVRVWGTKNAWKLSSFGNTGEPNQECDVALEISGDDQNGYLLVMAPHGFFTADSWHQSKQEALESAKELFGVSHDVWSRPTQAQ